MNHTDLKALDNGKEDAYPYPGSSHRCPTHGLTKRELFAAMAMQGAVHALAIHVDDLEDNQPVDPFPIARDAVKMADALLKELAK